MFLRYELEAQAGGGSEEGLTAGAARKRLRLRRSLASLCPWVYTVPNLTQRPLCHTQNSQTWSSAQSAGWGLTCFIVGSVVPEKHFLDKN